jgi:hypothetical protein
MAAMPTKGASINATTAIVSQKSLANIALTAVSVH